MTDLRRLLADERPPTTISPQRLVTLALDRHDERRTASRRRVGRSIAAVAAAAAVLAILTPGHDVPSYVVGRVTTGMVTCGRVPHSSGPKAAALTATLTAPDRAPAGATIQAAVTLATTSEQPITVSTGLAEVMVVKDGYVVGRYPQNGGRAGIGAGATVSAGLTGTIAAGFTQLDGCPRGIADLTHPTGSRPRLEPGRYGLVGVLTDPGRDGSADETVIVSQPASITVS